MLCSSIRGIRWWLGLSALKQGNVSVHRNILTALNCGDALSVKSWWDYLASFQQEIQLWMKIVHLIRSLAKDNSSVYQLGSSCCINDYKTWNFACQYQVNEILGYFCIYYDLLQLCLVTGGHHAKYAVLVDIIHLFYTLPREYAIDPVEFGNIQLML